MASWVLSSPLVFIAGAVMVVVGWRGRRIGSHPFCRRCGFDLHNGPAGRVACPECGSDITRPGATRIGNRQRRPVLLATGIVLGLVSLVPPGLAIVSGTSAQTLQSAKPVWWLRMEAHGGGVIVAKAALGELARRQTTGQLSAAQVSTLIDDALRAQADASHPWEPQWGSIVEHAIATGGIDAARMDAYGRGVVESSVKLVTRARINRGDPIPLRTIEGPARCAAVPVQASFRQLWVELEPLEMTVGDRVKVALNGSSGHSASPSSGGSSTGCRTLTPEQWSELPDGPVEIAVRQRVTVSDDGQNPRTTLVKFEKVMKVRTEIVPVDQPTVRAVVDPALRAGMSRAIQVRRLRAEPNVRGTFYLDLDLQAPPVGIAFDLFAEKDGKRWNFGPINLPAGKHMGWGLHFWGDLDGATRVNVILEPSEKAARSSVEVFEYWGEPVVFPDVEVTRPAPAATQPGGVAPSGG